MNEALRDVRSGRQQTWLDALGSKSRSLGARQLIPLITRRLGPRPRSSIPAGDISVHQQVAKSLLAHLSRVRRSKCCPTARRRWGVHLEDRKARASPSSAHVKVNGVPAVTTEQLDVFIDWVEASRTIAAMDQAGRSRCRFPDEDTLGEKLQWHRHRSRTARQGPCTRRPARGRTRLVPSEHSYPVPDWNNLDEIRRYADAGRGSRSRRQRGRPQRLPSRSWSAFLQAEARSGRISRAVTARAVRLQCRDRDLRAMHAARRAARRIFIRWRTTLRSATASAPSSIARLRVSPTRSPRPGVHQNGMTDSRRYEDAWRWEMTGPLDSRARRRRCERAEGRSSTRIEHQIRSEVEHLAAERAWGHAVAPGRSHRQRTREPHSIRAVGRSRSAREPASTQRRSEPRSLRRWTDAVLRCRYGSCRSTASPSRFAFTRICTTSSSSTRPRRQVWKRRSCSTSRRRSWSSATTSRFRHRRWVSINSSFVILRTSTWPPTRTGRHGRTRSAATSTKQRCGSAAGSR